MFRIIARLGMLKYDSRMQRSCTVSTHGFGDVLNQKGRCSEIVDGTVKESLHFFLVDVHCYNVRKACVKKQCNAIIRQITHYRINV